MRRKVIQDWANVLCQRFVDVLIGHDAATLAHFGSGTYEIDILSGESTVNGVVIPALKTCHEHREWLENQMRKHGVPIGLVVAVMTIKVEVSEIRLLQSAYDTIASARFKADCQSEIRTDEKAYFGHFCGDQRWGWLPAKSGGYPKGQDTAR